MTAGPPEAPSGGQAKHPAFSRDRGGCFRKVLRNALKGGPGGLGVGEPYGEASLPPGAGGAWPVGEGRHFKHVYQVESARLGDQTAGDGEEQGCPKMGMVGRGGSRGGLSRGVKAVSPPGTQGTQMFTHF